MTTKLTTIVLLTIIAVLSGALVYETVQRHQDVKKDQQFFISLGVQLYQRLKEGDVEAVKRRLGGDVAANAMLYEQRYGPEIGTKFEMRLSQAKEISADFHVNRPPIYDESADGSKQIAAALDTATNEHKRVLLMFGANWCGWCHKLHTLFEADQNISDALKANFVVVMIDVNKGHNTAMDARYGKPTQHGLPVIVILEADGKQLTTEDTGLLEDGDHHNPQKVLAFLKAWTPKQ